jgi:hypothetical protein
VERTSFRRKLATLSSAAVASAFLLSTKNASADITLAKMDNGWEFYTNGRLNAFLSWAHGDGMPVAPLDAMGQPLWQYKGAGGTGQGDSESASDPIYGPDGMTVLGHTQGVIDSQRVRSGFVGNIIGFGVKRNFDEQTKVTGQISIWSIVESVSRRKYFPNYADVREGYLKIEGPWGSFLAGKALSLFNRGATEANFMYLHGYGLGYPGSISVNGPAAGMIGFGILASTFSGGLVYATPSIAGIQLSAGIYDPAQLTGSTYERTGWARPEGELTIDEPIGTLGKVHLYANGTTQKLYAKQAPDSPSETAAGYGFGGRIELGAVHLAAGRHAGRGLGLTFALEPSEATYNGLAQLRDSDGYYVMGQVSLGKIDINAGYGRTRVKPLENDLEPVAGTPYPSFSIIYTQTGTAGAIVYHAADWLHFDIDVMHADFKWTLGDRQQINFYNAGTTVTW